MDTYAYRYSATAGLVRFANALAEGAAMMGVLARRLDGWLAQRRHAADDLDALARMSERELRDIGLSRGRIPGVAGGESARDVPDWDISRQSGVG